MLQVYFIHLYESLTEFIAHKICEWKVTNIVRACFFWDLVVFMFDFGWQPVDVNIVCSIWN